ncbi:MAG: metallophosphatase family protein [Actinobacteria bacterium]|nr:metallophosphatase family protein [Actinomycetota bacterium]
MKALAISDTHVKMVEEIAGLDRAIRPYLADVDVILHAGDMLISEALEHLESLKPTYAVAGNMDSPDLRWTLKQTLIMEFGRFKIGLAHGRGAPEGLERRIRTIFSDQKVDCILFGHSHYPFVGVVDGVLMVNPGSLLDKRFALSNTLAIITANEKLAVKIVEVLNSR